MDSMDDLVVNATLSSESERSRNTGSSSSSSSRLGKAVKKSSKVTGQTAPAKTKTKSKTTTRQTTGAGTATATATPTTKNPLHVASPPLLNPFNILSALVPNSNGGAKSNSNRSVNSSNESTDKNSSNNNTTNSNSIEANKYNHDIQQARMIQQGIAQRKQQQQQQQTQSNSNYTHDPKEITEADVRLGLDGLDQAEDLRSRGRTREALKVSELALELLIKFLRSSSEPSSLSSNGASTGANTNTANRISRDKVEARVLVALSVAEEMKAELRTTRGDAISVTGDTPSQPSTTAAAAVNTLSNSLRAALGKVRDGPKTNAATNSPDSATRPAKTNRQVSPTRGNVSHSKTATTSSAATNTNTVKNRKKGTTSQPSRSTGSKVSNGNGTTPSNLLNSQDPLVQTVKNELYIPHQQLQSTTWDDIAGLEDAKQALQEAAILPLIRPDLFSGLRRPRNILLYGPPGTGKTLLVKAIAYESKCLLFVCTASSLTSKWHGEGEKLLRTLFEVARQAAPSIIFVDEMDALLSKRKTDGEHEASRRFKTEFLTQMDGIVKKGGGDGGGDQQKNLLVLGATNTPWDIDDAVLRRFPRRIYIPLPDETTRTALLSKLLETGDASNHRLSKKDTNAIVRRLSGFSGSDISSIASEASFGPIRSLGGLDAIRGAQSSDIRPIERQDFDHAIEAATKSVSKNLLKQYETWKSEQQASA